VVRTSKVTGEGFGELASQLDRLCGELGERPAARHFRLPIDRVFTMKGFGTVVTGTLVEGRLAEGEAVEVAPGGVRSKVRGLQVHNRAVRESLAGMRTAVNLQGVEKEEVARGDVLVPPEAFLPTHMVDVHLEYLPTAPWKLKQRARVRFHTGTSEILGRVVLLDRQLLEPGDAAYAQLRLESPTLVVHGDPFVIRSYSPTLTIGGGLVLDGLPPKHRRNAPRVLAHLREIHLGDPARVALAMVRAAGIQGLTRKDLDRRLNLPQDRWREIQAAPGFRDEVQGIDGSAGTRPREEDALYMAREIYERLQGEILEALRGFGREHPLESGIPREDLRGRCPSRPSARAFTAALQDLLDRREVSVDGDRWRWKGHRLALEGAHQARLEELAGVFREAGLQPPLLKEAGGALGVSDKEARDLAEHLARRGELVKVKEDLYFHQAAVQGLQDRLVSFLKERGEIQPLEFKEMTQLSRKYMIPLLEHFDRIKVTMRVGDKRVLRG
jgi:selenocysteine-specific elongation factor